MSREDIPTVIRPHAFQCPVTLNGCGGVTVGYDTPQPALPYTLELLINKRAGHAPLLPKASPVLKTMEQLSTMSVAPELLMS